MEEKIKQRLIGILVIIGALFIILPFLFHNSRPSLTQAIATNGNANTSAVSVTLPSETQPISQNNTTNNASSNSTAVVASNNNNSPVINASANPIAVTPNNNSQTTNVAAPVSANVNTVNTTTMVAANTPNIPNTINTKTTANNDPAPATKSSAATSASEVITSATSGSVISSSGLTRGEGDDQPDAMQKKTANAMPVTPIPNGINSAKPPVVVQPAKPVSEQVAKPTAAHMPEHVLKNKPHIVNRDAHHSADAYLIQVGAFDNENNAERLVAQLRQHHFEAYSRTEFHDNRKLAVVFVGSIRDLHQAELDRERINREFHINGEIRKPL